MMGRQALRSRYFQEIAQAFLDLRGAPFVVSAKDLTAISSWEELGVPLRIVLEGIEKAFEKFRARQAGGRKVSSLSYCNAEVLKAFAEFRDRRVGRVSKEVLREEKKKRLRSEVEKFLRSASPEVIWLKGVYEDAIKVLSRRTFKEEELEKLEEKAEDFILLNAREEDRSEAKRRPMAEPGSRPGAASQEIYKNRLVKLIRERYRIPHLSLFYY